MDAIELLEKQHREVEGLFSAIEKAGEKASKEKKQLFKELALKLETHTKLEEKLFYPEGAEADEDMTLEAYEEHDLVKGLIRKLSKTKANDETFMAKITVLKELVEHHVKEEEKEYFPECRKELGEDRLTELGEELMAEQEKILKRASKATKN